MLPLAFARRANRGSASFADSLAPDLNWANSTGLFFWGFFWQCWHLEKLRGNLESKRQVVTCLAMPGKMGRGALSVEFMPHMGCARSPLIYQKRSGPDVRANGLQSAYGTPFQRNLLFHQYVKPPQLPKQLPSDIRAIGIHSSPSDASNRVSETLIWRLLFIWWWWCVLNFWAVCAGRPKLFQYLDYNFRLCALRPIMQSEFSLLSDWRPVLSDSERFFHCTPAVWNRLSLELCRSRISWD